LFEEKQNFSYAVIEKTFQTDNGKALVRKNCSAFNAHDNFCKLTHKLPTINSSFSGSCILILLDNFSQGGWSVLERIYTCICPVLVGSDPDIWIFDT